MEYLKANACLCSSRHPNSPRCILSRLEILWIAWHRHRCSRLYWARFSLCSIYQELISLHFQSCPLPFSSISHTSHSSLHWHSKVSYALPVFSKAKKVLKRHFSIIFYLLWLLSFRFLLFSWRFTSSKYLLKLFFSQFFLSVCASYRFPS